MTDEQINISIAEACGWHDLSIVDKTACGLKQKVTSLNGRYEPIPDYVNDLNAMHEAEHRLCKLEFGWRTYADALEDVVGVNGSWAVMGEADKRLVLHATSRQRAEAFLRTLGKWEEVQP